VRLIDSFGLGNVMRGEDQCLEHFFTYVRLEDRIPADHLSMAETNCAKWRRESVPVGLREKGFEARCYFCFFSTDLDFGGRISFVWCFWILAMPVS
jgi:hypothetical protein